MQINLSRNELKALLTRTFEALYGHGRDYHDMAHAALWLECCGHGGVAALLEASPYLEQDRLLEPSLIKQSDNHFIMDSGGHSLFCTARYIGDLTMALALEQGAARLDVINTQNSPALIGVLQSAARQGFAALALCKGHAARIEASTEYPVIFTSEGTDIISFICAQSDTALEAYTNDLGRVVMDASEQIQCHSVSLERGIEMAQSTYDALNLIANRVLVEATEASRKGAGE